jgi:hypothetical protein
VLCTYLRYHIFFVWQRQLAKELYHWHSLQADDSGDVSDGTEFVVGNDGSGTAHVSALPRGHCSRWRNNISINKRQLHVDNRRAQDAFVVGMIYGTRSVADYCPVLRTRPAWQEPWTCIGPWVCQRCAGRDPTGTRFAMELAGYKARRHAWEGLGYEMARAGWFDC